VDQYQLIRELYAVEGLSQRQIAKMLGVSRHTVKRYCEGQNVPWERISPTHKGNPVVTPEVREFVQMCLDQDREHNRIKQKHTAKRIYDRLVEECGFSGGESTIRRLVREMKGTLPAVYVPLAFAPGEAAQIDWGTATVIMAGQKVEVNLFCSRLCASCAPFVMAFPSQREEAFLEAHVKSFEFFGGVAETLIYDNLKTAVKEGWGKTAREQDKFKAFRAHYAYQVRFCNPGEGHEKGLVENLVGYIRRNVLVPIPRVENYEELNTLFEERCRRYIQTHQIRGRELSVSEAYVLEQKVLVPLPIRPYETAKIVESRVDYFSTATFEGNRYSVPVKWAGQIVSVKATAFEVRIFCHGEAVAVHPRSYLKGRTIYALEHYIPLLEVRPRSVFNARPVREAGLPRELFEYANAMKDPEKGMVRLLRLVVDHGVDKVLNAIKRAASQEQYTVELVHFYVTQKKAPQLLPFPGPTVQRVDLANYDLLYTGGGQ
jgi:transposase